MATTKSMEKAQALINARFGIFGQGCFDVYLEEVAEIFDILNEKNYQSLLEEKYNVLAKQRLG